MNDTYKELLKEAKSIKLLYVEDNPRLRTSVSDILKDFFPNFFSAEDGKKGFELLLKHDPQIIITDIKMPLMDGLSMSKKILKSYPNKKVIIFSAYDEKKYLLEMIRLGIFRYIPKPAKSDDLLVALRECIQSLNLEEQHRLFEQYLHDIFNYQNNLVMMFVANRPVVINHGFSDFFKIDDLDALIEKYNDLTDLLLPHEGFLSSQPQLSWIEQAMTNEGKLFHVKMRDHKDTFHHFILKCTIIPERNDHAIFSFNDITELNLMQIFDKNTTKEDNRLRSHDTAFKMLKVAKDNAATLKIHNFYRGIPIVNNAALIHVDENRSVIKAHFSQLKIVEKVRHFTISSEAFPESIYCLNVNNIDYDNQTITFLDARFLEKSDADRKKLRLEVSSNSTATIIYNNIKFPRKTRLIDLSEDSARIIVQSLPSGLQKKDQIRISLILNIEGRSPLLINTVTNIAKIDKNLTNYQLIVTFKLSQVDLEKVQEYLSIRQIELIKEFKAL